MSWKSPAVPTAGIAHETESALIDAQETIRVMGKAITIKLYFDNTVTKDKYGSIKSKGTAETLNFYSYPLNMNPTEDDFRECGLKEKTDILVKTAMRDWTAAGYNMERLHELDLIRAEIIIDGMRFELKSKVLESQMYDTYLYVLIGANRI